MNNNKKQQIVKRTNLLRKGWIITIIIVIMTGTSYVVYSFTSSARSRPDPCHCVELVEKLQVNEKLTNDEMLEYQRCVKKYQNIFAAQSACWNKLKLRDNPPK